VIVLLRRGPAVITLLAAAVVVSAWLAPAGARAAAPPQVSPLIDSANGQLLAFARASTGDVVEFTRSPSSGGWTGYDLSALDGVAPTAGPVLPYADPDYGSGPIAFAPGSGGAVVQDLRSGGPGTAWRSLDLSGPFGLGTTARRIVPWTDPNYGSGLLAMTVASNGDAVTISRQTSGGAWHRYDLTSAFGLTKVAGPLLPYTDPQYGSALIAFGSGPAGHVIELDRNTANGTWSQYDLTAAFGAGPVNPSGIVPYTDTQYGGGLVAFAVGSGGDVLTFSRVTNGGSWNHYDLSSAFGLPRTNGPVAPATDPANGNMLAFYPAGNGDVIEVQRNPSGGTWSSTDLTAEFGLSPVAGPLVPFKDSSGGLLVFGETPSGEAVEFARQGDGSWRQVNMGAVDAALKSLPKSPVPVPAPTPTRTPVPRGRHALKVRLVLYWTWHGRETTLVRVRVLTRRLPHRLHLRLTCRRRGCPFKARSAAGAKSVRRLLRRLAGRRFRAGDRLLVSFTLRGWRPDRTRVTIRVNRLPRVRLVR
jgi:hypothetical protein